MIRATGLGSGLDIDGLVSGLVAAEGDPARERLLRDEGTITSEISAFSQMNSSLLSLKSASDALNSASAFTTQKVSSSASSEVLPTLSGEAAVGSYSLSVTTLASAQTLATASTFASVDTVISTGTLSISLGTPAYNQPYRYNLFQFFCRQWRCRGRCCLSTVQIIRSADCEMLSTRPTQV